MNSPTQLKQISIVSRWVILLIDLCICFFSLTAACIININFNFSKVDYLLYAKDALILLTISVVGMLAVKTYAGIIRYTSTQDSRRILLAVLLINGALYAISTTNAAFKIVVVISNDILALNAIICFTLMVTYRVLVKYFFIYVKNINLDKRRVIIYGAGEAGVATKRTLNHDLNVNKTIIAFVDDDKKKIGKTIDGIDILDALSLPALVKNLEFDEIIFAANAIPIEQKNKIVDICLENDIKVLSIPPNDTWNSGEIKPAHIHEINIEDLLNRETIEIDVSGIQNELKGKKILITGAAGSIGSEIVRQLMQFETGLIIMCDQSETALHHLYLEIKKHNHHSKFTACIGDVKDEKRMDHIFDMYRPEFVYHAAAYKHVPLMEDNPAEAIKTNVLGTKTIADLSVRYSVEKFVMISTDKAVNPTNVMGASKRIAEMYVQSLNKLLLNNFRNGAESSITRFITTRFGNVLGSNGSVIPLFTEQIKKGGPVTVTHPEITRYFMTIPEACRLVLEAAVMGRGGEIYIFDMGKSVKIVDLANKMIRLAGLMPERDIKIKFCGLRPGEKLYEELLNNHENTMPTHHEKIMIGKVREYGFIHIDSQINELIHHAKNNDDHVVVMLMKKIVVEFKSKNSVFEELDLVANAG
jgi:FlaA1/EpsC-like NDP-sugar epimerase